MCAATTTGVACVPAASSRLCPAMYTIPPPVAPRLQTVTPPHPVVVLPRDGLVAAPRKTSHEFNKCLVYAAPAAHFPPLLTAASHLSSDTPCHTTPATRLPRSAPHWCCSSPFSHAASPFSRAFHAAQVRQLIADNKFEEAAAMLPQGTAQYIREVTLCAVAFEFFCERWFGFERLQLLHFAPSNRTSCTAGGKRYKSLCEYGDYAWRSGSICGASDLNKTS
jgi:hypothetical protein